MSIRNCRTRAAEFFIALSVVWLICTSLNAQQSDTDADGWAQILGPQRNGRVATDVTIDWQGQPKTLWEKEIGAGFSGPILLANELIVFHRPGEGRAAKLVVEKINADDGKLIWKQEIPTSFRPGMDGDAGPKATPLIDNDHVYCFGPNGELFCLQLKDGKVVWQENVREKFGAAVGYFGCGSSPIVIGKNLLLNVGGQNETSIVAFDKTTGAVEWNAVEDGASYSSPVTCKIKGVDVAVFLTRTRFVGLEAATGKVLFSNKFGKRGPTAIGAMPVLFDETKVLATAAYRCGAVVYDLNQLDVENSEALALKPIWKNAEAFASHYSTPIYFKGHFYGTSGREDIGNGSYRCIDAVSGAVKWDQPNFPVGHSIGIGKQLLVLDHRGKLSLIEANAEQLKLLKSAQVFDGETRAIPAYSDGRLFFRSNARNGKATLKAIKVAE